MPYRSLPISTADAEDVTFTYDGSSLVLNFADWQECARRIRFPDCQFVRWQEQLGGEAPREDASYESTGSDLLGKRKLSPEEYRHYIFGFNALGEFLEVVSAELQQEM